MLQFCMRKNKGTHVLEPTKISTFVHTSMMFRNIIGLYNRIYL